MIRRMKTKPIPKDIGEYLELSEDSPSGLIWKKKSNRKTIVGSVAGSLNKTNNRWEIRFKRKLYYCYRVVYFLRTQVDPVNQYVEHSTRKCHTNDSLRLASQSENMANQENRKDNTSGFKGVSFDKRRKTWKSSLGFKGKKLFLGRFKTKEEAARAYNNAALEHFGEFAYLNPI